MYLIVSGFGSGMDGLLQNESNVTCSVGFYLEGSTCFPLCEDWKQFSDVATALTIGSITAASVMGFLGGIAVILGSLVRYDTM